MADLREGFAPASQGIGCVFFAGHWRLATDYGQRTTSRIFAASAQASIIVFNHHRPDCDERPREPSWLNTALFATPIRLVWFRFGTRRSQNAALPDSATIRSSNATCWQ